ncbi:MAG TPA: dynamin family protein [Cyanobacteria bacterium UBA11370]|nr:dynamin family protein [Cyanobacteria bacterium UBA11370]
MNEDVKRILLLAANPKNTYPLRLDKEVKAIESGLMLAKERELFIFKHKWAVDPTDVHRAMLEFEPHIVHFSGHGEGIEGLVFESNEGDYGQLVSTDALAGLFGLFADQVECVILNACYSEIQAEAINRHISYVIGMNQSIGDKAAIAFSVGFYDALGAGRPIEFAYRLGCNAIQLSSSGKIFKYPQHLIPVLKTKSARSIIFPEAFTPNPSELQPTNPTDALAEYDVRRSSNPQDLSINQQSISFHYNLEQLSQEFIAGLDDFSDWVETEKIRNVLGRDLIRKLRTQEKQIRARLDSDFSLVVVGDFKRGKSTLINALLGSQVVSTAVTSETVTINVIQYGDHLRVEACLVDGGRVELQPDQLPSEQLLPILKGLPKPISHLHIEVPVEWLKGLCLVDTPGTGDIMRQFDKQVHTYLSQADVLIYVMFTPAVLSESERAFLKCSVLPQDFPKVFFVVNRLDEISEIEAQRLMERTRYQISNLFPNSYTFGLSALDEFCRLQDIERPNPSRASALEAEFQLFRNCIHNSILLNKNLIQLDRATDLMDQMLFSFEASMALIKSAMQSDQQRLNEAIQQCENTTSDLYARLDQHKQQIRQKIDLLCEEALDWMNIFVTRLEHESITSIPQSDLKEVQKHFHFFLTDALRKAVSQCIDTHSPCIAESVDKTLKLMTDEFQSLSNSDSFNLDVAQATFGDLPWTNLDTFNLLLELSGSDGIFELAGHLLLRQAKDLQELRQASQYVRRLKDSLHQLRQTVAQEVRLLYDNIAQKIETRITEVYQQAIEASISAMRQAQEIASHDSQHINSTNEGLREALSLLSDTRAFLKSFKQKLWSKDAVEINRSA